jgi:translation initiation factor IF-2
VILKGDVDGSVEALSDLFSKSSTEEIQINIIHKVGAITETDVMLASFDMQSSSDLTFVLQEMLDSWLIRNRYPLLLYYLRSN